MNALKVSFFTIMKIFELGIGYISLFFISRYMGPEALGILSFGLAYIALFQTFSDLGFGEAHIKRVSEGMDLGICNGTYLSTRLFLNIVMAIIVLATVLYPNYILNKPFISKENEYVICVLLAYTFVGNINIMLQGTFAARKKIAKISITYLCGKIVTVTLKVIVAVTGLGVIWLAFSNVAGALVIFIILLFLFREYPIKKPTKAYFKSYLTFAIPVIFIGFMSKYSENIDMVMIQFFWSSKDVGLYAGAKRIAMLFSIFINATSVIIFPSISAYHAKGRIDAIRNLSKKAERYISLLILPGLVFFVVFSKEISTLLLGDQFIIKTPEILSILSVVAYINAITSIYILQIGGTNHIRLAAVISFITLGLNILLNIVFIPKELFGLSLFGMGAIGAAYATLLAAIISGFIYRYYAFKITKSKTSISILFHILAAIIMGISMHILVLQIPNINFIDLLFSGLIGIIIYTLCLYLSKEITRDDIWYFMKNINPVNLRNYALKEMKERYKPERNSES